MTARTCYDCVYREALPGDTHSACRHPLTAAVHADQFSKMLALFGKRAGMAFVPAAAHVAEELGIAAVPHGVAGGWFLWPVNFDPVWLVACEGFTPTAGCAHTFVDSSRCLKCGEEYNVNA